MRADNLIIIGLALVAVAFSAVAILRRGRLPIRASAPSGSGVDGRPGSPVRSERLVRCARRGSSAVNPSPGS